jgi:RNA polymerase sigma-70 factor (ECF subfamily)
MDALLGQSTGGLAWDWRRARQVCLGETRRVLGSGPASEDAAQEAMLRAWRHRHRCRDPHHPGPWLRQIARNEAMRIAARPRDSPLDTVPERDWHGQGSDAAEETTADLAHRMLTGLPTTDRRLVFLQHWKDAPISEIAALLQMPEGTVKIRLHRAREAMRRMIEQDH